MGYKRNTESYRANRNIPKGEHSEFFSLQDEWNRNKIKEEERLKSERAHRKNLHETIVDLIIAGRKTKEIKAEIVRITNADPDRIQSLIEHWQAKQEVVHKKVDEILSRLYSGEITIQTANRLINTASNGTSDVLFQRLAKSYYRSELSKFLAEKEKGNDEEER